MGPTGAKEASALSVGVSPTPQNPCFHDSNVAVPRESIGLDFLSRGESSSVNQSACVDELKGTNGIREINWDIRDIGDIRDIRDIRDIEVSDAFRDVEAVQSDQIVGVAGQTWGNDGLRRGSRAGRRKKGSIFDNPEENEEDLQGELFL